MAWFGPGNDCNCCRPCFNCLKDGEPFIFPPTALALQIVVSGLPDTISWRRLMLLTSQSANYATLTLNGVSAFNGTYVVPITLLRDTLKAFGVRGFCQFLSNSINVQHPLFYTFDEDSGKKYQVDLSAEPAFEGCIDDGEWDPSDFLPPDPSNLLSGTVGGFTASAGLSVPGVLSGDPGFLECSDGFAAKQVDIIAIGVSPSSVDCEETTTDDRVVGSIGISILGL